MRNLVSAAAYGGGGLSLLGAGLYGVLRAQARLARRTIGRLREDPPDATGWYGAGRAGPALTVALLGDSAAAGYGVDHVEETPGAVLAASIAESADRRVYLGDFAVVGAQSSHLAAQIDRALPMEPHLAVVIIGANDVTHSVLPYQSVRYLAQGVRRLRAAGVEVVVGTCPDLGTVQPIPPPLRQVARTWSRRLAAAQTVVVLQEGGRTVSLGSVLGPDFQAEPTVYFGPDRFHPSVAGYRSMTEVMVPAALEALGVAVTPVGERSTDRVLPVVTAALEAVQEPGTELDGTQQTGPEMGWLGRWVPLRRTRQATPSAPAAPQPSEQDEDEASGVSA